MVPFTESTGQFSLLTYNVFTGSPWRGFGHEALAKDSLRLSGQIEEIKNLNPDILFLQELYDEKVFTTYQESLSDYDHFCVCSRETSSLCWFGLLEFGLSLLCYLFLQIVAMGHAPSLLIALASFLLVDLVLRYGGFDVLRGFVLGSPIFGEAIFWKKDKFRLNKSTAPSAIPFRSQKGDLLNVFRKRGFLVVTLDHMASNHVLKLLNVHTNSGADDGSRLLQTQQITSTLSQDTTRYHCILCSGDFNAQPTTPSVQQIVRQASFLDVWHQINPQCNGYTWDNQNTLARTGYRKIPDERVDFIFVKGEIEIQGCEVVLNKAPFLSDHFGVFGSFSMGAHKLSDQVSDPRTDNA